MLNISSQMSAQMQISLLDEGLDLHTGLTSAYSSKPTDGQWTEKKQEFEKEQEASDATQCEDNDVNAKVLQNKNRNGSKRVYECPVCLKRFGAPSKLKRHCLIHTDQRPFQCSICCRAFRELSHLKAHFRTHTNPSSPDAVTPAGKGIFPVSKSSDRTCMLQLKKKSGYQCEICLKKFSFPSKLTRHMFVHFDVKAYTCTICRKSFKQAYYLHKHLKVHTGKINGNSRLCSVQQKHGAKSPKPEALERANNCRPDGGNVCLLQILDSLETKKHEKLECRSKSNSSTVEIKSSDTLKNAEVQITTSSPIDLKHTHKGVNQCSICLKNFPYPSKLARHILSHTDIRPFKCHVCLKSFQFRWHLQCHVRIHKKKSQDVIADHLEQDRTVYFGNAAKSEEQDVQISLQDGAKDSATVHQDQNMVKENMMNPIISGDCSDSGVYLQVSLLNEGRLDLPTKQSSAYSPKPSEGLWMEENQESAKEKEASVTTQNEDKYVNAKVLQSKNCNGNKRVYDCPVCHKRFGAPSKLKRHRLIHTNQRPFQCSICCRAFRERSHLKVHIRTHTNPVKRRTRSLHSYNDNNVPCNRTSKSRLKPFPKNLTAQNDTCSTNKQKTGATDLIETNAGTMGVKVTREHWCPLCLKCFKAPSKLKRHILIHTGQRPFKCSVCPKTFREKSHLKVHKCTEDFSLEFNSILSDQQVNTVKHNANEGVVSTAIDDSNDIQVRCSSPDAVTIAEKRIFPISKSSDRMCMLQLKKKSGYQCEICLKKFSFRSELTRHMHVHFDGKPYTCTICRKSFKQAYYLHKHLKVHTGKRNVNSRLCSVPQKHGAKSPTPGAFECTNNCRPDGGNVCLPQILDSLENKKHEKPKCQSKLNQNVTLTESNSSTVEIKSSDTLKNTEVQITTSSPIYLKHTHKGVNQCSICLKNFPYPSKLARHILSHTDSRPFKCHVCLKSFQFQWHLQCHVRIHKKKSQNIIAGHLEQDCTVSFSNTAKSEEQDVQISLQDGAEDSAKVNKDQNMVMGSQKISGDYSNSGVYLQDSLLNKEGLDFHTGRSSAYSSKPAEGQWMEEIQESEEEQEASVTTQSEDNDVNAEVSQSKNFNGSKRVYDCPVCHKRFGSPSKLKRHCLIHTNQRPFQCSICCRAFRERSHLKVHIRTHTNPVKRRTRSLHSYKNNSVPCNRTSKSRLKPFQNYLTVQNNASSTENQQSIVHQDENMVTENVASQIISGDCSESDVYLQDSLLNKEGLDLHTGLSSAYSSNPSEGQWMDEIQESEEVQEASVRTQSEDNDVNSKVWQSENSNGSRRVYDCPVCHKRFGAPSKLKRHCIIHTNQRPFQCSICCRAFRERSHLKVHFRTHNIPEKRRTPSHQSYRDNSMPCNRASKSRLKPSPKQPTAQDETKSTDKQKSTVHQDDNMVTENMASQIISGDCSESDAYLHDSLLNKEGLDLHTGLSSAYSSNPSEGQWMEEIQESEEEQEASVTTQSEDNDVNVKVLQSKNSNGSKRVYDCPVCHKRFGAPSDLKRHCLIHTNQRPFQCSICCRAFRERSHLKVHIRTHTNPVKRTRSLHSYKDYSVPCNRTSKSKLKPSPKYLTVQNYASSTENQQSKVHQDENMVTENMASQIISGDCSESDAYLHDSLLNKEGLDLHTGLSSAYSSNPSEGQWMEEIQESEEEQEASVTTESEDNDVNVKVSQSKNFNGSKRVYDCPVCHKRFDAPSELKRHCLIHTNQRPFQCSICCRAFRERSHLKVHIRTHTNPVKRRTRSLHSYKNNSVPCNRTSKSRLKPFQNYLTVQNNASSTENQQSIVHQDENMVTENVASQIISGDCSESDAYLHDSLLNKEGLDLHTGLSSAYSSNHSEGQWMEEIQESEEEQEASVTTQSEDNDVNVKVLQSKNSNGNKRVYDCPVCHKRFGAPSELKRHCLIHTNQRPFQCSICCRAFRERSHLKVHFRTHNIPEKRRTPSHQSYRDNSMPCNQASKSRLKPSPIQLTAQDDTKSTDKQKSTVHQDQNVLTEDIPSQKMSAGCSDSGVYLSKSTSPLENVENKVVFWCNNKSVWDLTHKTDILLDGKKASDIVPFGRVSDCPPKTDSSLPHCAPESRTEEKWAHHMDNIEDCVFVDSDTVVMQCVPDSYEPSSCQYQQKPDVPRLPEVVVELEDFEDPGECFIKPPHDLPFCPDCNQSFRTIRNLYAHNCANRYPEGEMKKSHQCDICFKFFNAPSKLKRHYVTHTGQRAFQCTQCQKSFTQSHHLKTHMLSHR